MTRPPRKPKLPHIPKLTIETIRLSDLHLYAGNTKIHTDKQISAIAASIREFGFNDPIAIDQTTHTIIEGHGRYHAALLLGLREVPVIVRSHLSDVERRAYTAAHNKTSSLTSFDLDKLATELADLLDAGLNMTQFGFDEDSPGLSSDLVLETKSLKPFRRTHVLISFPPERLLDLQDLLDQIRAIDGVEYEQASN